MEETGKVFRVVKTVFGVAFCAALFFVFLSVSPAVGVVILICGLTVVCARFEIPRFPLLLFIVAFFVHLLFVVLVQSPLVSDFSVQYEASRQFAKGNFTFAQTSYFQRWAYQTGLVVYQGLLLKLVPDPNFLRVVNCFVAAGTNVLVYAIAKEFFDRRAARCAAMVYLLFLFHASLVTVLCNNIPSAFFLYLSVYLVVQRDFSKLPRLLCYGLAGISMAVAGVLRPDVPLLLIPYAVYFVFRLLSSFQKENVLYCLKRGGVLFLAFLLSMTLFSQLIIRTGVNPQGLSNHDPLWGLVVGTDHQTGGVYQESIEVKVEEKAALLEGSRKEAQLALIRENLSAPLGTIAQTVVHKLRVLWWDRALDWSLSTIRQVEPSLFHWLEQVDGATFGFMLVLAGVGFLLVLKKKKIESSKCKVLLVPFLLFMAFCVYLLLEVQPRYAYTPQIAVFILAAGGIEALFLLLDRLFPPSKKEEEEEDGDEDGEDDFPPPPDKIPLVEPQDDMREVLKRLAGRKLFDD